MKPTTHDELICVAIMTALERHGACMTVAAEVAAWAVCGSRRMRRKVQGLTQVNQLVQFAREELERRGRAAISLGSALGAIAGAAAEGKS